MRPRLGLLLVLSLLVGACGGGGDSDATVAPTPTGLTRHTVAAGGFSIAVPPSWRAISVDDVLEDGRLTAHVERTPGLAQFADALRKPNAPLKFVALDRRRETGSRRTST